MREFALVDGNGEEYSLTVKESFLHDPSGLGFERENTYRQVGERFIKINTSPKQGKIEGTIHFHPESAYDEYQNFVEFAGRDELQLEYKLKNVMARSIKSDRKIIFWDSIANGKFIGSLDLITGSYAFTDRVLESSEVTQIDAVATNTEGHVYAFSITPSRDITIPIISSVIPSLDVEYQSDVSFDGKTNGTLLGGDADHIYFYLRNDAMIGFSSIAEWFAANKPAFKYTLSTVFQGVNPEFIWSPYIRYNSVIDCLSRDYDGTRPDGAMEITYYNTMHETITKGGKRIFLDDAVYGEQMLHLIVNKDYRGSTKSGYLQAMARERLVTALKQQLASPKSASHSLQQSDFYATGTYTNSSGNTDTYYGIRSRVKLYTSSLALAKTTPYSLTGKVSTIFSSSVGLRVYSGGWSNEPSACLTSIAPIEPGYGPVTYAKCHRATVRMRLVIVNNSTNTDITNIRLDTLQCTDVELYSANHPSTSTGWAGGTGIDIVGPHSEHEKTAHNYIVIPRDEFEVPNTSFITPANGLIDVYLECDISLGSGFGFQRRIENDLSPYPAIMFKTAYENASLVAVNSENTLANLGQDYPEDLTVGLERTELRFSSQDTQRYSRRVFITKLEKNELDKCESLESKVSFECAEPWIDPITIAGENNAITVESDSHSLSPCTIYISGPIKYPKWDQYVNGVHIATGSYNGYIPQDGTLEVHTKQGENSMILYTDSNAEDVYQNSDFNTDRFMYIRYGTNEFRMSVAPYIPTLDSAFISGKTYYERAGEYPDYVYTATSDSTLNADKTYYESNSVDGDIECRLEGELYYESV